MGGAARRAPLKERRLRLSVGMRAGSGVRTLLVGACLLVAGAALLAFPTLSHHVTANAQAKEGEDYAYRANQVSEARFEAAVAHNEAGSVQDALELLKLPGVEPIARLRAASIGLDLPVYATSSDVHLLRGAGYLGGSSAPVGGVGTHSVITAHSGMPTKRMFDRLPKLEVGDTILVDVLGRTLAYQVAGSQVLPAEAGTEHLRPTEGADQLTLVTCTPYGVNTHRLLVTATRTEAVPALPAPAEAGGSWLPWAVVALAMGLAMPLTGLAVRAHQKRSRKGKPRK